MPLAVNDTTIHIGRNSNSVRKQGKPESNLPLPNLYGYKIMFAVIATIEEKQTTVLSGGKFQPDVQTPSLLQC